MLDIYVKYHRIFVLSKKRSKKEWKEAKKNWKIDWRIDSIVDTREGEAKKKIP